MTPYRRGIYQTVFWLAAVYNLGFGVWAGFWPQSFFSLFELELPRYPGIWRCLGMVVGLYGLLYAHAALHPDRARPVIAVGLLGKLLGPAGWAVVVANGEWPVRTVTLIVFNDVLWWLPFSLFLLEGTRAGERIRATAPWACAALNAAAALALLTFLRPGTEVISRSLGGSGNFLRRRSACSRAGGRKSGPCGSKPPALRGPTLEPSSPGNAGTGSPRSSRPSPSSGFSAGSSGTRAWTGGCRMWRRSSRGVG